MYRTRTYRVVKEAEELSGCSSLSSRYHNPGAMLISVRAELLTHVRVCVRMIG